jgi:pilus assembly protein CpaF
MYNKDEIKNTQGDLLMNDAAINSELATDLLKRLMREKISCIITGTQGVGKTTLMWAMSDYIDSDTLLVFDEVMVSKRVGGFIHFARMEGYSSLGTEYARTTEDIIASLAQTLAGDEDAERKVVDALKMDIHLNTTIRGERYIERVTEIVALEQGQEINGHSYATRDILTYDHETHTYWIMKGWRRSHATVLTRTEEPAGS